MPLSIYVGPSLYICIAIDRYRYRYIYIYIDIYIDIYIYIYREREREIHICLCICLYIYIYIYILWMKTFLESLFCVFIIMFVLKRNGTDFFSCSHMHVASYISSMTPSFMFISKDY